MNITNAERTELLPPKLIKGKTILYRVIASRDRFHSSLLSGLLPYWAQDENEMGAGIYYTYDLDIAKGYTKSPHSLVTQIFTHCGPRHRR
jgi:hypothetical protein